MDRDGSVVQLRWRPSALMYTRVKTPARYLASRAVAVVSIRKRQVHVRFNEGILLTYGPRASELTNFEECRFGQ